MRQNRALDTYDVLPEDMRAYLSNYGFHFSKKACDFAVRMMRRKNPATNKEEPIEPWGKEQVDEVLKRNAVTLDRAVGYDYVYVANMGRADHYKGSLETEKHLALYVKETIDDVDASDETVFRQWLAKLTGDGCPIEWYDIL